MERYLPGRTRAPVTLPAMPAENPGTPDDPTTPERPPGLLPAGDDEPTRFPSRKGVLLAAGVAAFLLGGVLLGVSRDRSPVSTGPAWSAWEPSADGAKGAEQIAAHVGPQYRGPDGRQLVRVDGGALEVSGLPVTVAMRDSQASGGAIERFEDEGVLYRLCGMGNDCPSVNGTPSIQRHLLLRREALELALYSLRHLDDVKDVVVLMPPRLGEQPSQALFFRRHLVSGELDKPLEATLVARTPTIATVTKSPDALLVEQLTIPALFRFSLTRDDHDDRALLLLDPFTSPAPESAPRLVPPGSGSSRSNASVTPGCREDPCGGPSRAAV